MTSSFDEVVEALELIINYSYDGPLMEPGRVEAINKAKAALAKLKKAKAFEGCAHKSSADFFRWNEDVAKRIEINRTIFSKDGGYDKELLDSVLLLVLQDDEGD